MEIKIHILMMLYVTFKTSEKLSQIPLISNSSKLNLKYNSFSSFELKNNSKNGS